MIASSGKQLWAVPFVGEGRRWLGRALQYGTVMCEGKVTTLHRLGDQLKNAEGLLSIKVYTAQHEEVLRGDPRTTLTKVFTFAVAAIVLNKVDTYVFTTGYNERLNKQ